MAEPVVWALNVPPPETLHVTPAAFESFVTAAVIGTVCAWSMLCVLLGVNVTAIGGGVEVPHPESTVRRPANPERNNGAVTRFTIPPGRAGVHSFSRLVPGGIMLYPES